MTINSKAKTRGKDRSFRGGPERSEHHIMCRGLLFHSIALLIVMLAGLTGGGCASNKIAMTPPVKMAVVPDMNDTFYNVEKVTIVFASSVSFGTSPSALPSDWKGEGFANQFTRMAEERYPGLFKKNNAAIPIAVRIDVTTDYHQAAAFGVYLCTLCIVGGVFPSVPWTTEWQVKIHAEDARGAPILSTGVHVENPGWWSILTPLGLIDIPGDSDAPKVSTMMAGGPGVIPLAHRTYVTQCMVDLLAAELLKQDPRMLPARSPAPVLGIGETMPPPAASTVPTNPATMPTALPLPTETVAPF